MIAWAKRYGWIPPVVIVVIVTIWDLGAPIENTILWTMFLWLVFVFVAQMTETLSETEEAIEQ